MIKVKNEIFNNLEFIKTVKKIYRQELPAKDSYKLLNILKELTVKSDNYNTIKNKILEETGYPSKEENNWQFESDDKFNKFQKQFNDLLDVEIVLQIDKIKCPESLLLSPYEMQLLEDFFDYGELDD